MAPLKHTRLSVVPLSQVLIILILHVAASPLEELSTERSRSGSSASGFGTASGPMTMTSLAGMAQLGQRSSFRYANGLARVTAKGVKRVRLIQTYGGYDVFGSGAEAEMDVNDELTGHMYGNVVKNIHRSIRNPEACQRRVSSLQRLAIRMSRLSPSDPNIEKKDARRIIFAGTAKGRARLAYKIQFFYAKEDYVTHPVYFFDACSGIVLLTYDQINNMTRIAEDLPRIDNVKVSSEPPTNASFRSINQATACSVSAVGSGGNIKIGRITYNSEPFCLNVQRTLALCRMEGTYSKVVDNQNSGRFDKQTVASFLCASGYNDAVNGAYGVANDALYYGEIAGRFFEEKYSVRALSYKPRLVVHFRTAWENAIWDGTDMYFGDGASFFHPLTDLGVIAHELSHGVTSTNSDLVYRGMSGGINEAFSDITAETTEFFARGTVDWLVGGDITKDTAPIRALRFFEDPPEDGRSIKHVLAYRPLMDVHFSSGVFNHAFYLMVTKENMDIYEAYKCFLDANLNLWKPFSNFFSAACNVMQAAYDNGFSHRKVRRSFWRVGIPLIFCRYAALTTSMLPGEIRREVMVSASRSPILKVELDQKAAASNATSVVVEADDKSTVGVTVCEDDEASKVVFKGDNSVILDASRSHVYVQLTSSSPADVKVTVKVNS